MSANDKAGASAKTDDALVACIVAPGRTVNASGKKAGPGETVHIDPEEVGKLRRLGYLIDESVDELPRGAGPSFDVASGPTVRGK